MPTGFRTRLGLNPREQYLLSSIAPYLGSTTRGVRGNGVIVFVPCVQLHDVDQGRVKRTPVPVAARLYLLYLDLLQTNSNRIRFPNLLCAQKCARGVRTQPPVVSHKHMFHSLHVREIQVCSQIHVEGMRPVRALSGTCLATLSLEPCLHSSSLRGQRQRCVSEFNNLILFISRAGMSIHGSISCIFSWVLRGHTCLCQIRAKNRQV